LEGITLQQLKAILQAVLVAKETFGASQDQAQLEFEAGQVCPNTREWGRVCNPGGRWAARGVGPGPIGSLSTGRGLTGGGRHVAEIRQELVSAVCAFGLASRKEVQIADLGPEARKVGGVVGFAIGCLVGVGKGEGSQDPLGERQGMFEGRLAHVTTESGQEGG
jgi:hypothetical protein